MSNGARVATAQRPSTALDLLEKRLRDPAYHPEDIGHFCKGNKDALLIEIQEARELSAPSETRLATNNALATGERKPVEIAGPLNDTQPLERVAAERDRASQERVSNPVEGTTSSAPSAAAVTSLEDMPTDAEVRAICDWMAWDYNDKAMRAEASDFYKAIRKASAPSSAAVATGWIPVGERLPVSPAHVAIRISDKSVAIEDWVTCGYLHHGKDWWAGRPGNYDRLEGWAVTHWMPLPSAAPAAAVASDHDRAEFLAEAQAQLSKVLGGDIEAVRWMIQTAADYHANQAAGADAIGESFMVDCVKHHETKERALLALLGTTSASRFSVVGYYDKANKDVRWEHGKEPLNGAPLLVASPDSGNDR